jgi:hypothetical protein
VASAGAVPLGAGGTHGQRDAYNYKYITNAWNLGYYTSVKRMSETVLEYPKPA